MSEEQSLQGWEPAIGDSMTLQQVIDLAFEYRGDVTIDRVDGASTVGYLFNRNPLAATPFVEVMETETGGKLRIEYAEIHNVRFTGKDTAAGQSWEAWQRRKSDPKAV